MVKTNKEDIHKIKRTIVASDAVITAFEIPEDMFTQYSKACASIRSCVTNQAKTFPFLNYADIEVRIGGCLLIPSQF